VSQIRLYIDEDSGDTGLVRSLQNQAIDIADLGTLISSINKGR
jgi:hypothetical protein